MCLLAESACIRAGIVLAACSRIPVYLFIFMTRLQMSETWAKPLSMCIRAKPSLPMRARSTATGQNTTQLCQFGPKTKNGDSDWGNLLRIRFAPTRLE